MDFRVGGKYLFCLKAPDGQLYWTGGEYHEIVPNEKIAATMYFADSKGNKIDPGQMGVEHESIDDAPDVILFEDLGNGQTKLTFIGNETMQHATESGQYEGWKQLFEKIAEVVATLAHAK